MLPEALCEAFQAGKQWAQNRLRTEVLCKPCKLEHRWLACYVNQVMSSPPNMGVKNIGNQ